jgi:hypothetical protein
MLVLFSIIACGDRSATPQEGAQSLAVAASIKQLPVPALTRVGQSPGLTFDPPTRTDSTCGYQFDARHLYALSNQRLSKMDDIGRVSPVVVLKNGKPLDGFAPTRDFEEQCAGAFNFGRNAVRFSPDSASSLTDVAAAYSLGLSDQFPLPTPDGDAWWAYPGTRIDVSFPDDGGLAGQTIELVVSGVTPQGKVKATPLLRLGESRVLMEESEDDLIGRMSLTVPDGPWTASLVIPPDGPYMVLTAIDIISGSEVRSMLPTSTQEGGSVVLATGPAVDLLDTVQFVSAPPALTVTGELSATGDFLGRLEAPTLAEISSTAVREITGVSYSPLRILEDGKPLAQPNSSCRKVKQLGNGRYCHSREVILLSSSDNTAPLSNQRSYTLTLSEDRRFEGGWWLYPGDALRSRAQTPPPPDRPVRLVLSARAITADGALSLKLRSGGSVLIEQTIPGSTLKDGTLIIPMPVDVALSDIELELDARGHVVLQGASIQWDS